MFDSQEGFIVPAAGDRCQKTITFSYRAVSDLLNVPVLPSVLDYISRSCNLLRPAAVFDPLQAVNSNLDDKPDNDIVQALSLAVRYTDTFTGLLASNCPDLGCQGVEAMLHVRFHQRHICLRILQYPLVHSGRLWDQSQVLKLLN